MSTVTESPEDLRKCSRCEKPLDTTGFPKWCKACQASYRREYNSTRKQMAETRGFAAGVAAMRKFLVDRFGGYRIQHFSGPEIAGIIQRCDGPDLPDGD